MGRARIDAAKIVGQSLPGHFRDGAGHFHAGCAAADHYEGEQAPPLVGIVGEFGALECDQNAAANARRIFDALEARRELRPVVMAEIGMRGAGRDHQIVEFDILGIGTQQLLLKIDAAHLFHQHRDVFLRPQDMPDRPGHVRRRQRRGGHLVEQRLKAVMVLPVDKGDVGRRAAQRAGSRQAAKACADDDNPRTAFHCSPSP